MTFDKLHASTHYVAVSVPSTQDVDTATNAETHRLRAHDVARVLSRMFGGASTTEVEGGWVTQAGGYVEEPIKRVMSYAEEITPEQEETIIGLAKSKAKEWGQEAIMVELDGRAYFIN